MQVGVPADREQYIHRLGRTGRKGKEGQGLLLLAPWEKYFLGAVKDLSIAESAVPPVDSSVETEVSSMHYLFSTWLSDSVSLLLAMHVFFLTCSENLYSTFSACKYNIIIVLYSFFCLIW